MRQIGFETCDQSTSEQAVIGVTVKGTEFVFCRHHFHQNAEALAKAGGEITALHPDNQITVHGETVGASL